MKKVISLILTMMMLFGVAGCSERTDIDINHAQAEQEIYLSRPVEQSVYGVEAPDGTGTRQTVQAAETVQLVQTSQTESDESANMSQTQVLASTFSGEVRGVWMSYLTLEPMIKGKTQTEFVRNIRAAFQEAADFGMNTVFVQVRPFGDALYDSGYFPWSSYLTGTEGVDPGYDPLALMCSLADEQGLRIEAWLNPYRVRLSNGKPMSDDNQAKKWLAAGSDAVIEWNGGVYYNPGSPDARKLIVNGVREIVQNYDVDGIHFDDYFYPTTDMSFDASTWQASGSGLSQADWRRENVNILVREVYAAIKEIDSSCLFGISPQGNLEINYEGQFADVAVWLSNPGYVDYICPQIYYGYRNSTCPFAETVEAWNSLITVEGIKLYVGLAPYKLGAVDQWAGEGKNEWLYTTDLLAQMVRTARRASHYGGVLFYSYESLFQTDTQQVRSERANLKELFT